MRASLLALLLLIPGAATAFPPQGELFPRLKAPDVAGKQQDLYALLGEAEGPTLVVMITHRGAGDRMRAWYEEADRRGAGADRLSLVSVKAPFIVSESYARSRAQQQVPKQWWSRTLFDASGKMSEALGLPESKTPYVAVVNPDGTVRARVHAAVDSPEAAKIWEALGRR